MLEINTPLGSGVITDDMTKEELYDKLITTIKSYHPSTDFTMLEHAYNLAVDAHKDQYRKSGEPYIIHPINVAIILAELKLDKETIIAGILHDVIEDTNYTYDDIKEIYGEEIAILVDGVTKLTQLNYSMDKIEIQAENLRKMFLAMAKDIRVILIKLADRLHNMRTLQHMIRSKQIEKSRETMDIYAPIAQRLGISKIKIELDDLSLKYLEPEKYEELINEISSRMKEKENFIESNINEIKLHMAEMGIKSSVSGRVKHNFSIYKKMVNQNKTLDQIYDLYAIRILVNDIKDCYATLGIMHEMYKPIPGRFKDYIAMPKPNMYQSLHTTLISSTGTPFEVQIRTYDMHKTAEFGIAAHWKYKEIQNNISTEKEQNNLGEEKLAWLRQILEWQKDMTDNKEFLSLIKSDFNLFADKVFCFTPDGDVKDLPAGSNTIDFAYSIHSAVGNKCVGARVNGKLVPLEHQIKNGDIIEIITSQNSRGPSRDWLKIVKSSQAKNKINHWFKSELKENNIIRGKELIAQYAKQHNVQLSELTKSEYIEKVLAKYGFRDLDSMYAAIGHGGLKEGQIINKLQELKSKQDNKMMTDEKLLSLVNENPQPKSRKTSKNPIIVEGISDIAVRFSKCCNPVPGDEIIGFITRGRGVSIHRTDCVNILGLSDMERNRLIESSWKSSTLVDESYNVEISIYAYNRIGLLLNISKLLTEENINITNLNSNTSKKDYVTINLGFRVQNKDKLRLIINKLRSIEGIIDVER